MLLNGGQTLDGLVILMPGKKIGGQKTGCCEHVDSSPFIEPSRFQNISEREGYKTLPGGLARKFDMSVSGV